MKLYRATNNYTGPGSCWAKRQEDALAYRDNPGYGGENIITTEVNPLRCKILWVDKYNSQEFAHLLISTCGTESALPFLSSEGYDDDNGKFVVEFYTMNNNQYQFSENWLDDEDIRDILAKKYDWAVYTDTYPRDCETWVKLK